MKIRIERALYDRARNCADAVHDPLSEWIAKAIRQDAKGVFTRVAYNDKTPLATRASVVARVNWAKPMTAAELHGVLQRACAYCEARTHPPFVTSLREGVDYLVAADEG